MQVRVGVVPPAEVVEAVADVIRAAQLRPEAPPPPRPRGRWSRRSSVPAVDVPSEPPVTPVPADQAYVYLAGIGSVTLPESQRLADALADAAAEWPAPRLHVGGLPSIAEDEVAVELRGDVAGFTAIAQGVVRSVEPLGLFVDRRRFRAALVVGTLREGAAADPEALERVTAALAAHRGEPWTVDHLSLLRLAHDDGGSRLREIARLPLATG